MDFALQMYKTLIVFCWMYLLYAIWDYIAIKIGARTNYKGVLNGKESRRSWED